MARITVIYQGDHLWIEYDHDGKAYNFLALNEDGWVSGRDGLLGALAVVAAYVKESV